MKIKMKLTTLSSIFALAFTPIALAEKDHGHDHGHEKHDNHGKKGPNGGHLVVSKAGFIIEVSVDKEMKQLALVAQTITGIAGARSAPVKLAFTKGKDADTNILISDNALPAGAHVGMILTIKTTADAKAAVERFELHLH
jgi:hypothetical protein